MLEIHYGPGLMEQKDHESGFSLDITDDGGFVGLGTNNSRNGDLYLVKADEFGNELWSKDYGGEFRMQVISVEQTSGWWLFPRWKNAVKDQAYRSICMLLKQIMLEKFYGRKCLSGR